MLAVGGLLEYSHTNRISGFQQCRYLKIPIFFVFAVINITLVVSAIAVIGLLLDLIIHIFPLC